MAADAGRDPASLEVSVFGIAAEEKVVKRYRDAGVDRAVFGLPPAGRDVILPVLDRCAKWTG
jgi:hypothetical protein